MRILASTVAAVALLAGTSAAFAEDWSGFYVGAQGGYGLVDASIFNNFDVASVYASSTNLDGLFGGLHAGVNFQSASNLVFGFEADINMGKHAQADVTETYNGGPYTAYVDNYDVKAFGSGRIRLGYASGNIMPYLTVGLAMADLNVGYVDPEFRSNASNASALAVGYTIGGGLEYAINQNLRLRAEYRFTDYGTTDVALSATPFVAPTTYEVDLASHTISMGISYAF